MIEEGPLSDFTGVLGALRVHCRPTEQAVQALEKADFTVRLSDHESISVEEIQRDDAPRVHAVLSGAKIDIYESQFEKTNLEQMFLSTATKGEKQ